MIFIKNARAQIGPHFLLMNLKANTFYNDANLRTEDFEQLFEVLRSPLKLPEISEAQRTNLLLITLYNLFDSSRETVEIYKEEFERNESSLSKSEGTELDKMHKIFNIVECEIKLRLKSELELKRLFNELTKYGSMDKSFEDYLLLKFYVSYLKYILKDYNDSINCCNELIIDINEKRELITTNLLKYLQIRNILLLIKSLEASDPEKNKQEIISNLDSLFEWTRGTREDLAIALGMKWHNLQADKMNYNECVNILTEMLKVLHRETLFGRSHKNITNQYLHIYTLLGLYNSMLDKKEDLLLNIKGIEKSLNFIKENERRIRNGKNSDQDAAICKYDFYGVVLKSAANFDGVDVKESVNIINSFKNSLSSSQNKNPAQNERDILNLFILSRKDKILEEKFSLIDTKCIAAFKNNENLPSNKLLIYYFYLYNTISLTTEKIVKSLDEKSKGSEIIKARNYANIIIDYTYKKIASIQYLKEIFKLPFFKKLFNRINFIFIYSYYLQNKYEDALKRYETYEKNTKFHFELKDEPKSYAKILKIKADCLFKLKKFEEAERVYGEIFGLGVKDEMLYFNLGTCYAISGKKFAALNSLENCLALAKGKKKPKEFVDVVLEVMKKVKEMK